MKPIERDVECVIDAIEDAGLRSEEQRDILDDWLLDQFGDSAFRWLGEPTREKVYRLIEAGVSAQRLVDHVYDYLTP